MKSLSSHAKAGQHNLKGKKRKLLSCKCCVLQDLRDKEETKVVKRELRAAAAALKETGDE